MALYHSINVNSYRSHKNDDKYNKRIEYCIFKCKLCCIDRVHLPTD